MGKEAYAWKTMVEKVKSYKELLVWQKGVEKIDRDVSQDRSLCPGRPDEEGGRAEGQAHQHRAEFKQFLYVALGSLAELDTQMAIAKDLGYIREGDFNQFDDKLSELRRMLRSLISKLTTDH